LFAVFAALQICETMRSTLEGLLIDKVLKSGHGCYKITTAIFELL